MTPGCAPRRLFGPRAFALLLAALPALLATGAEAAAAKPRRIVSLNLCTDQLLADLVPRERIVAVSFLGTDPTMSAAAGKLAGVRTVQGAAEEVIALDPDLVVTSGYTTPATIGLLQRLERRVVVVPLASDFEGIRTAIRTLAEAVGEPEMGIALSGTLDSALRAVGAVGGRRPTAVALQVNSLVSSKGSLVDAVMMAAGFENIASSGRLGPGGRLPLEVLVTAPPDLVILAHGPDDFRTAAADNLRHPALQALLRQRPSVKLGMATWLCGTPAVVDAVRVLAEMRLHIQRSGGAR